MTLLKLIPTPHSRIITLNDNRNRISLDLFGIEIEFEIGTKDVGLCVFWHEITYFDGLG